MFVEQKRIKKWHIVLLVILGVSFVFLQFYNRYHWPEAQIELKGKKLVSPPEWILPVKSSAANERLPTEPDFWFMRCASILRSVCFREAGVRRLRRRYGGRKDYGMAPPHFKKSSGKIIRIIIQQAEKAGFLEKAQGKRAGRQLTAKGKEFLETVTP